MALTIKNNGPEDDEPAREFYGDSWMDSTTAREPKEGDEPEFNPEAEFDTFKVPKGAEKQETVTSFMDPNYHSSSSMAPVDKSDEKLKKTLISLGVLALLVILVKLLVFPSPKDLTSVAALQEEDIASQYHITFERDEEMDRYIPQYSNGTIEAKSGKGLTVFSIDGVYSGWHFDNTKWTVYGIKVGMAVQDIPSNLTFKGEPFMLLNDMLGGSSTADYYVNEATNECLVITISDRTGRIAAITYWKDFKNLSAQISF